MKKIDDGKKLSFLMDEVNVSLVFTSIMAMASFVLMGFLLQSDENTLNTLRFPLVYIFIGAIAFIYSTNIYANVSGGIARLGDSKPDKQLCLGNIIAEIYGFYLILFALPMAIFGFIKEPYIIYSIFGINIVSIFLYSQSRYSILYRYLKNMRLYLVSALIILIYSINFICLVLNIEIYIILSSVLLIVVLTSLFMYMLNCEETL